MNNIQKYLLFKEARDWGVDAQGKPLSYQAMKADPSMSHMSDFAFKNWARTKGYSPVGPAQGAQAGVPGNAAPAKPQAQAAAPQPQAPKPQPQAPKPQQEPIPPVPDSEYPSAQQEWNSKGGDPSVPASPSPRGGKYYNIGNATSPAQGAQAGAPGNDPFANGVPERMYTTEELVDRGGLPGTPIPPTI